MIHSRIVWRIKVKLTDLPLQTLPSSLFWKLGHHLPFSNQGIPLLFSMIFQILLGACVYLSSLFQFWGCRSSGPGDFKLFKHTRYSHFSLLILQVNSLLSVGELGDEPRSSNANEGSFQYTTVEGTGPIEVSGRGWHQSQKVLLH